MFNNYTKITTAFAAFALLFSTTSSAQCDPEAVVVDFSITMGSYPDETSWTFNDPSGVSIASDGPVYDGENAESTSLSWTLPSGDYTFIGSDSYGDGWDSGSATFTVNGVPTVYSVAASDPYVSNTPTSQSWTISLGCEVLGCTDPDASNYNADANAEDGSCCFNDIVTFNLYDDYGSGWLTNFTDGSQWVGGLEFEGTFYPFVSGSSLSLEFCVPAGCFSANMFVDYYSYDASWEVLLNGNLITSCINTDGCATASYSINEVFFYTDDGSCVSQGCMDDTQCNFNPLANVDDGSCELLSCGGCMDQLSCNWNSFATLDDGSCDYDCIGCTDSTALNYDLTSTISCDACCSYCTGAFAGSISVGGGPWDAEIYWSLMLGDVVIASQEAVGGGSGASLPAQDVCLEPGCYSFVMNDDYGDGWNGSEYVFTNYDGEIIAFGAHPATGADISSTDNLDFNEGACAIGCSQPDACNYNLLADFVDDELCDYSCVGCMDPTASNYDPNATIDSGLFATCSPDAPFVLTLTLTDSFGDGWNDATFGIFSTDSELLLSGDIDTYGNGAEGIVNICLAPGCYTVQVTAGSSPGEIGVSASDQFGAEYGSISGGETLNISFAGGSSESCGFVGCTSPTANNYDFNADVDCLDEEGNSCCEEPAPNDLLENAEVIACASYSTGSLLNSNDDQDLAGTNYGGIAVVTSGVWYVYNAAANEQVTVSTCATPSNEADTDYTGDTKIHIYTQSADGLIAIASNDDGCESGYMSSAVFNAETGSDYFVYVSEYSLFTGGNDFILEVSCTTCDAFPSNDLSCDALALVNGETFSSSTCCSGNDPEVEIGSGTTYGTSYGVWFTFNSSDYDALDFLVLNTDGSQVGMNYFGYTTGSDNTCADLDAIGGAQITGNYDAITSAAFNDEMLENTIYYFCVFTTDLAGCGMFDFTVSGVYYGCTDMSANNYDVNATDDDGLCDFEGVVPSNNICEDAVALTCNTLTSGSTGGANNIGSPVAVTDCETAPGNGVWYSFVGDGQLHNISTCGSVIDSKINIYSAEIACGGGSFTEQEADPCGADLVTVNFAIGGGGFDEEISWSLADADGLVVADGGEAGTGPGSVCLAEGDYTLTMIDSYGDGWNGGVAAFQNHIGESIGYFSPMDIEIGCADTDNGAEDAYGDGCAGYTLYPSWCNGYDDDDFVSSEMCCACGGGEQVGEPNVIQTEYATLTVSAYSMDPIFVAGDFTCVASASSNDYSVCTVYDQDDINLEFISTVGTLYYMLVGSEAGTPEGSFDLEFTCNPVVEGCNNPVACNYVAESNVSTECDFFSCVCASETGSPLQVNMDHALGAGWSGATYTISDISGLEIYTGGLDDADYAVDVNNYEGNDYGFDMVCLEAGCYTITTTENDSFYSNTFNITDVNGDDIVVGTNDGTWSFSVGGAVCGCTDMAACNYELEATYDDGSCESESCSGCTDMSACNYNSIALVSDPDACCYQNCLDVQMFDSYGDGWGVYSSDVPTTYILSSVDGTVVGTGTLLSGSFGVETHCLEDGCYTIEIDCVGDCGEVSWTLVGAIGGFISGGPDDSTTFSVGVPDACLVGCDISCACNYNPDVNIQDVTMCVFSGCDGCTYPDATNYDGTAISDDGSCTFEIANPCPADLNGDGSVTTGDLLEFLGAFGTVC